MLRHGLLERSFAGAKFFFDVMQRGLRFRSRAFELQHFGIERAQLALHSQWSRFGRAAAAHHAALIRGAVGSDKRIRGILAREPLRHRGLLHQERRLQPRQELLRRRPQRIAEFHQAVEPRNGFLFDFEGHDRLVRLQIQLAERIHEERRAPADFLAQQRDSRARHVERLHDDIFQFVAQELLDGALVLLLDFGVIGQHADGAETVRFFAALIRSEQFLDRIRRVGAIVQDLFDRSAPRAASGQRIPRAFRSRRGFVLLAAKFGNSSLRVSHDFFQAARALEHGLPVQVRGLRAVAMVQRFFEQLLFLLFVPRHALDVMRQGLLGLRLIAVQARQFVSEFGGGAPQRGDARLGGIVRAGNFRGRRGQVRQNRFDARDFALKRRNRLAMRRGARFHLGGLRGGLLDFDIQLLEAAGQFRGALPVEENAILAAVQFERRLPEHVLVLPQFAFEFIRARAKTFLLGFPLAHRLRFLRFVLRNFAQQSRQAFRLEIEFLGLAGQHLAQQAAHLLADFRVPARLRGLPLERRELLFDFDVNVVDAGKIDLGGFELGFGKAPLRLEFRDSGRFFDDGAPVGRLRAENLADAALLDDRVGVRPEADAHEQILNVAQPRHAAIDEIFALPGAVQAPANDDFAGLQIHRRLFRYALFLQKCWFIVSAFRE